MTNTDEEIDFFDAGCMPWTGECVNFQCQTWESKRDGSRPVRPKLVQDERGFWICPKCGGSYGRQETAEAAQQKRRTG